jgi:flagellar hook assembly protein FlgD
MSESQLEILSFEENGESYEIYIESKANKEVSVSSSSDNYDTGEISMGYNPALEKLEQARKMMRGYAMYAISAFKDFGAAEIEEVTLKFGMKIGGKAGIPFITEGTAESNLEIEVKCKIPPKNTNLPG